ncbi:hypothetical protein AQUCO_01900022v1 [Aquilegia coerulea]|uniref:CID domain-containing protein n=1 Tax=Aquilegia coerulea TaxID=218851 RepID=A0A2G5DIM4_AQUCA|nr:hypothetical protein AQUCO_01900022v1 [Aquilegia coerulea]
MEMDSRRSIGVNKKPRLIEDSSFDHSLNGVVIDRGNRSFSSSIRPSPSSSGAGLPVGGIVPSRYNKINERERDIEKNDSIPVRAGGVGVQSSMQQPQQQQQQQKSQQQNQELVSQYKTALAELTFNSKPIITNLTIIAGENLHVAKWIAATICANILEVPAEQKLPSLYLLDSIVKNIGRDYIKYFATKLPEVFCKAYRQVDTAVHSGMRHLFGTWKGVFPPGCLQMIEKDLGFPPAINGSSSSTVASRSESQSQRPPQSIHVNPKYLEARQRLQQSSRAKEVNASSGVSVPLDDDDTERPDRSTTIGSKRPWTNLPIKEFKHPKREASSDSVHEKNSVGYEDNGYSSDTSRNSDLGYVRAAERVTEQDGRDKSWYPVTRNIQEATASQRTTFDTQREFTNYRTSKPGVPVPQLQQKGLNQSNAQSVSRIVNKNWKTSEEEEYMWDDMRSRDPRKRAWIGDDAEKMEIETRLPQLRGEIGIASRVQGDTFTDSLSLGSRGQSTFGQQTSSPWPLREPHLGDGSKLLSTTSRISGHSKGNPSLLGSFPTSIDSSLASTGLQTHTGLSVSSKPNIGLSINTISGGVLGQPRSQPLQAASPSGQSSMLLHPSSPSSSSLRQHQELHNSTEDDRHHLLQANRAHHTQSAQNSFPALSQNTSQPGLQNFKSFHSHAPQNIRNPSMQPSQRQHQSPFSLQPETSSPPPSQIQKPSVIGNPSKMGHSGLSHPSNSIADVPGLPNTSSVLATLMKSGILSNTSYSGGFPSTSLQDLGTLPVHSNNFPPLPSGRPPTQLATSSPVGTPASVSDPSATISLRTAAVPPLPPGPPPASFVSTSSQMSTAASNPFASLLSSLVAKGLITAEKESPVCTVPLVPSQLHDQIPPLTSISTLPVTSTTSSAILTTSSGNELPFPEPVAKSKPVNSQGTTVVPKDLIGTEFKADIIRQYHPSVINSLFEDLPHQCDLCGLRLKLRERLDRHLEWHALKKSEPSSSAVLRRWYASSGDWVLGRVMSLSDLTSTSSAMGLVEGVLKTEPVVPADETQCVCILCGEPFEDFYSYERDDWMFEGAVYIDFPTVGGEAGTVAEHIVEGPIVHKKCISPSSVYDLGLMKSVKQEQNDG